MANSKRKKTPKKQQVSPYQDEIILVVTLVVSILMILSYFNICGVFGNVVNFVLFGLFGLTAYLFPFLLFFGMAFGISNRGVMSARIKLISTGGLYVILAGILQLIRYGSGDAKIGELFANSAKDKSGGGFIGGILSKGMCYLFGEFGTYVIYVGLIAILVMLITEKFLFAGLKKQRLQRAKRREESRPVVEELYQQEGKKKAKVFTFSKEDKMGMQEMEEEKPRRKRKAFMEEVVPLENTGKVEDVGDSDLENLSIFRGYEKKNPPKEKEVPIYEEELNKKFSRGKNQSQSEPSNVIPMPAMPQSIEVKAIESDVEPVAEPIVKSIAEAIGESEEVDNRESEVVVPIKASAEPLHTATEKKKKETVSQDEMTSVSEEIGQALQHQKKNYVFPPLDLLTIPKGKEKGTPDSELRDTAAKLKSTLESFGVRVEMKNVSCGPRVTRYELQPALGVKVSKITSLSDDIKLSLAAADIRIEAPIPGKSAVGIEVPNSESSMVVLRSLMESKEFKEHASSIAFAVGKDIGGNTIVTDIGKMPHLLIAGATGSGKSVCINTLIMSILYKANPDDVKLIMVDPKVVELSVYNGIPHLLIPVVTDPKKASGALNWAVVEMMERYKKFSDLGVRDIKGYNAKVKVVEEDNDENFQKMPQIVIIVDELADLMMVAPGEVEDAICRLAQLARAAGIHLIIATQRPSVNVITGLIKANVPSRIAFAVSSAIDSRTILDGGGAEKLLGNGDMLFFPSGYPKPVRVQGAYVSDKEVSAVVEFLKNQYGQAEYNEEITSKITASTTSDSGQKNPDERDEYFIEAGKFIIEKDKASIGMLQRVYKIGYNRAARIMDQLYDAGVVGPEEGTKPRKVIMSMEEFENYVDEYV